jgi:phosphoglycerate dehydrogenase-like enzyme
MSKPLVIQCEELDEAAAAWLGDRCEVHKLGADEPGFDALLARASGLVVRTYTKVDGAMLARGPGLKVVGRAGVGLDNIDVPACRSRGVEVVHTPDANTRAVVELATAFMLDALRPRVFLDKPLEMKAWRALRGELLAPRQLADLTLGILGMGRVGTSMARVGAAFNMRVIYNDLRQIPESMRHGAEPVEVGELFSRSDILTVHIDDRAENRHFIDGRRLRLLPHGCVFINAARGFVVDPAALRDWLISDGSAQAVLDVHEPEPFGAEYPLLGLKNAHLSPHIGAATGTAHRNMSWVVRDVWRVLSGERPEFPAPAGR